MTVEETEIVETKSETVTEETRTPAIECHYCGDPTPKSEAIYHAIDIGEWKTFDKPCGTTYEDIVEAIEEAYEVQTLSGVEIEESIGWGALRAYCEDCSLTETGYVREIPADPTPLNDRTPRIEYSSMSDAYYLKPKGTSRIYPLTDPELVADLHRRIGPDPWLISRAYALVDLVQDAIRATQRGVEWFVSSRASAVMLICGFGALASPLYSSYMISTIIMGIVLAIFTGIMVVIHREGL